ncbi:MAG: N-acetyl-alpha-D-glucosaminyl L-malate synthase [Chlamydiae bacterium]|nr:N-acetyl-alpha-D-glucosaminyl L-malate synthase [Chlamydiota bacterium]
MQEADICLILEGTYPYISGGVAQWAHNLILHQPEKTFTLICILPFNDKDPVIKYELPSNIINIQNIWLQDLKEGEMDITSEEAEKLFQVIETSILNFQQDHYPVKWIKKMTEALQAQKIELGSNLLLNSDFAWNMLLRMYNSMMRDTSFLNFYWSWRSLLASFYSIMLAPIPKAKVYHSLCTGYAGALIARAKIETGRPCLLTEHGIYTSERRIEVTASQWINDLQSMDMSVDHPYFIRNLKDFWIDMFAGFSRACYESCTKIVTLYEGNRETQIEEGADPAIIDTIPNGIDYEHFSALERTPDHPPTIGLLGRVVPIKDVKSYIYATNLLREKIPNLVSYIMGSLDEDPDYYDECQELMNHLKLNDTLIFTGRVNIDEYFPKIDVIVLTSISEGQPLALLEAGAAGIPCVTTDVGSCSEIIYGRNGEMPALGPGGTICPLSNPEAVARESYRLLTNKELYDKYSDSIQKRVKQYYNQVNQIDAYKRMYVELMEVNEKWPELVLS